jgi:hypothetical protein
MKSSQKKIKQSITLFGKRICPLRVVMEEILRYVKDIDAIWDRDEQLEQFCRQLALHFLNNNLFVVVEENKGEVEYQMECSSGAYSMKSPHIEKSIAINEYLVIPKLGLWPRVGNTPDNEEEIESNMRFYGRWIVTGFTGIVFLGVVYAFRDRIYTYFGFDRSMLSNGLSDMIPRGSLDLITSDSK